LLENTFDRKCISTNPNSNHSPNTNSNPNPNSTLTPTLTHNNVFELTE